MHYDFVTFVQLRQRKSLLLAIISLSQASGLKLKMSRDLLWKTNQYVNNGNRSFYVHRAQRDRNVGFGGDSPPGQKSIFIRPADPVRTKWQLLFYSTRMLYWNV